jgi:hypothetical protein
MQPDKAGAAKPSPLDAERERLRKEGYTKAEISQILIARASAPAQAPGAAGQTASPGLYSGMLAGVGAAMSYARIVLPTLRDLVKIFDRGVSPIRRIELTFFLALKIVAIAAIAYAVKQEWDQHINRPACCPLGAQSSVRPRCQDRRQWSPRREAAVAAPRLAQSPVPALRQQRLRSDRQRSV